MKKASMPIESESPLHFESLESEIAAGIADFDRGDYDEYDSADLDELVAEIKANGRRLLMARDGRDVGLSGGKMSSD